jgi:FXSXX-COOH protein
VQKIRLLAPTATGFVWYKRLTRSRADGSKGADVDGGARDFSGDLIDVTGLSLRDLDRVPESSLALALRQVLSSSDTGPSAGFSSRV